MSKHTPAPWFIFGNGHCVGGPESIDGAGQGIAMCGMRARTTEEAEANARLIAAAPELLDALKAIEAVAVDFGHYEAACRTMQEIARKALGYPA